MKKTVTLKLLNLKDIDEYKKRFRKMCEKKLKLLNYDLVIFPEDFDHCCYEFLQGGVYKGKFSTRRARRMLIVEQFCKGEVDCDIYYEHHRPKKTIAFISDLAEFCLIALPVTNKGRQYFRFLTMIAFGKGVESGLKKIINTSKKMMPKDLPNLFPEEKNES